MPGGLEKWLALDALVEMNCLPLDNTLTAAYLCGRWRLTWADSEYHTWQGCRGSEGEGDEAVKGEYFLAYHSLMERQSGRGCA